MAEYFERLQALIGVPSPTWVSHYPVSEAMIHHWCDALGDRNPIYLEAAAARTEGHSETVAPPTMLQAWTMPGLRPADEPSGGDMTQIFEQAGFVGVVATNCDQEYVRYLQPGDMVTSTHALESVSDLKKTALGEGHFVSQLWTFRDADDAVVGTMRFRMLFFKPEQTDDAHPPSAHRPRPAMTRDSEFFWHGIEEGKVLIQKCADCGRLRHPPGPMCPACHSLEWVRHEATGRGVVYSYVRHFHPNIPPFLPGHLVALIELEEGVRMVADVIDGPGKEDIAIGKAVVVEINRIDDELYLPQCRLVAE